MSHYGLYRGKVVDNRDPQSHKRLKVTIPQLLGTQTTDWVWPREDSNTKVAVPSIGQGVWVMFEGGDPAFPVWVGVFGKHLASEYHGLLKSPSSVSGTAPYLVMNSNQDGTKDIDILMTLVTMAQKLIDLETRLATQESKPDPDA